MTNLSFALFAMQCVNKDQLFLLVTKRTSLFKRHSDESLLPDEFAVDEAGIRFRHLNPKKLSFSFLSRVLLESRRPEERKNRIRWISVNRNEMKVFLGRKARFTWLLQKSFSSERSFRTKALDPARTPIQTLVIYQISSDCQTYAHFKVRNSPAIIY